MSTKFALVLILGLGLSATACKKQENVRIKLTSQERALIDTMYLEKISVLRPYWDSLCMAAHDSLLEIALDSLIKVRREEEIKLRARMVIPGE